MVPHTNSLAVFRLLVAGGSLAAICHAQTSGTPPPAPEKSPPAAAAPAPAPPAAAPSPPAPAAEKPGPAQERTAPASDKEAKPLDLAEVRKKAEAGDAESQLNLADLIFSGAVKDAKYEEASALVEKASDSGYPPAQLAFSRLLRLGGAGVKADLERSRFLVQQAAEAGDAAAQAAYGSLLMSQVDTKSRDVDFAEPLRWYRLAADQGNPEGTCRLGMMRAAGQGGEADPKAAWALISKAARVGHSLALNEAGICLQKGLGVDKDAIAAIGYFHASADLGNVTGMVNLGSCYRNGNGVPRNLKKAAEVFALAAKSNFGPGHYLLAEMQERGEGVPVDRVAACISYMRAAAAGMAGAKERYESVKAALSEAQLKEVEAAMPRKATDPAAEPAKAK